MVKKFKTSHVRDVGQLFSQHDVEAMLESDRKPLLERWSAGEKSGGPKQPEKALAAHVDRDPLPTRGQQGCFDPPFASCKREAAMGRRDGAERR